MDEELLKQFKAIIKDTYYGEISSYCAEGTDTNDAQDVMDSMLEATIKCIELTLNNK